VTAQGTGQTIKFLVYREDLGVFAPKFIDMDEVNVLDECGISVHGLVGIQL